MKKNDLQAKFCEQLCSEIQLVERENKMLMISTPFSYPDGDRYSIYLKEVDVGIVRLSDGANTMMRLSYDNPDVSGYFEGSKGRLMAQILRENKVEEDDGNFYIDVPIEEIAKGIFHLGQALGRIYDLSYLDCEHTESTFYEGINTEYVPVNLYIDTQVFIRQKSVNSTSFCDLKDISRSIGGQIRLLFPEVTESEIRNHYSFQEIKQLNEFKENFVCEKLPLREIVVNHPEYTKEIIDNPNKYSEFGKRKKSHKDAYIFESLKFYRDRKKVNIAIISGDNGFAIACQKDRYFQYYQNLDDYIKAFKQGPVDSNYYMTEELTEIESIIKKEKPNNDDIDRVLDLLKSRDECYRFFFLTAKNPVWIDPLKDHDCFGQDWLPIYYLKQLFTSEPQKVLDILENIPVTENYGISSEIFDIALQSDSPEEILRLEPNILAFVDHARWDHEKIISFLRKPYIFEEPLHDFSIKLLAKLVEFQPDHQQEEKQNRKKKNPKDEIILFTTSLTPKPRFDQYEYTAILENGIYPLVEKSPFQISKIFIDATAEMCCLRLHKDELLHGKDLPDLWWPRLENPHDSIPQSDGELVRILTSVCKKIYENSPDFVTTLDEYLRNQKWRIFQRLRQHLYALYPSDQTKPWIRELILEYENYDKFLHSYEYQRMIRISCEKFGEKFLTKEEKTRIFYDIMQGPSKKNVRKNRGHKFTEDYFKEIQNNFHRLQFRPFASVLFGEYKIYYEELEHDIDKPIDDDDYSPRGEIRGGRIDFGSPKSKTELLQLSDQQLLHYINTWDDFKSNYHEDGWTEITIRGLAEALKEVFKESIIPNSDRIRFWINSREKIDRLVYVRAMVEAMQKYVEEKNFDLLDQCFEFCEWILSHPDDENAENVDQSDKIRSARRFYYQGDEHKGKLGWNLSRRAVGGFIGACLKNDVPISNRESLAKLLLMLCIQPDWELEHGPSMNMSLLNIAINHTRSRALEDLVHFGYWVRRNDTKSEKEKVPEVFSILETRFKSDAECQLTEPEYAILGRWYWYIHQLSPEWTIQHKSDLFPQHNFSAWTAAFDCFLRYHPPYQQSLFNIMREDFIFALEKLTALSQTTQPDKEDISYEFPHILGQHLFAYYLVEMYPLTGNDSLLEKYYQKTDGDRSWWVVLFEYVGNVIRNSRKGIDEKMKDRIIEFFDWRYEVNEPTELNKFSFWLQAELLDAEWRLKQYSKILDVIQTTDFTQMKGLGLYRQMKILTEMLSEHPELVLECFFKLSICVRNGKAGYIDTDDVKSILNLGLGSKDQSVRNNARHALDNLCRASYSTELSEFL